MSGKYNPYIKPDKGGYVILKDKKSKDLTKSKGIISATKANKYLKGVNIEPVFHIWPIQCPREKIEESVKYL